MPTVLFRHALRCGWGCGLLREKRGSGIHSLVPEVSRLVSPANTTSLATHHVLVHQPSPTKDGAKPPSSAFRKYSPKLVYAGVKHYSLFALSRRDCVLRAMVHGAKPEDGTCAPNASNQAARVR